MLPANGHDWETYHINRFIDRPEILKKIMRWIRQLRPPRRVLCLVAEPGFGKTWMLKKIRDELGGVRNKQIKPPPLVYWLNAPEIDNKEGNDALTAFRKTETDNWVRGCYDTARARCPNLPAYDPDVDFTAAIETLVDALANRCSFPNGVLVLVDGYDEIDEEHRNWLSERILSRFINNNFHKMQMIIPLRDHSGLFQYDLSMQQQIEPLSADDSLVKAYDQFKLYCQANNLPITSEEDFVTWQKPLSPYEWKNPYVNMKMAELCFNHQESSLRPICCDDIKQCVRAVLERPFATDGRTVQTRYPPISDEHFKRLIALANDLKEDFTSDDFEDTLKLPFTDQCLSDFVKVYYVLAQVNRTERFMLIKFLRDLLQATKNFCP